MGGIGSGRYAYGARSTTEGMRSLDVRKLKRAGVFDAPGAVTGWHWTRGTEVVSSIKMQSKFDGLRLFYKSRSWGEDWQEMDYTVRLSRTPCHLGGSRLWFHCPARGCGRRVAKLYGGAVYACRHCHRLSYASQSEDRRSRAQRRAEVARAKLGWDDDWGLRPKGMHRKTFERLAAVVDQAESEVYAETVRWLSAFSARFGDLDW
jgi:hypothetical protein